MRAGAAILTIGLAALAAGGGTALAQPAKPAAVDKPAKSAPPAPTTAAPAAAKAAVPPERTLLSVKDVMKHIINPAAETYWAHSGEVDDEKGANDRIPTTQEAWTINIDTAAQIAEGANLLMMEGRARDP